MSRFKTAGALVVIAASAFLLSSCNGGGAGIFYTLEKATAQTTSTIGDKRTVASMAMVTGTTIGTNPGVYYAGGGTAYTATVSSSPTWKTVTAPAKDSAGNAYICTSLTVDNSVGTSTGDLYAVYYNPTATSPASSLYYATVNNSSPNQSPSWSVVTGLGSGDNVQKVFSVNGYIFAVVGTGPYDLYEVSGGTATQIPSLSGLLDPPSAGTVYNNGTTSTTYWFIGGNSSGPQIYTSGSQSYNANPTGVTFTPMGSQPSSLPAGMVYRGIFYSSILNTVFVSTSNANNEAGRIYASIGGGSWSSGSIVTWPSGVTQTGLDGFDEYQVSSTVDAILVGADTGGYYEIDIKPATYTSSSTYTLGQPGNTTLNTAGPDYVSTTLASAHVIGFFNDQGSSAAPHSPQRIFGLTQNGLWLNEVVSGTQRSWTLQ